jgi:hypothetical protein
MLFENKKDWLRLFLIGGGFKTYNPQNKAGAFVFWDFSFKKVFKSRKVKY